MSGLLDAVYGDTLSWIYLLCFLVGFLYVVTSFVLGHAGNLIPGGAVGDGGALAHGNGHHGGHFDSGNGGTAHTAGEPGKLDAPDGGHHQGPFAAWLRLVNLSTIMSFLTWFGGVGFVLRAQFAMAAIASLVTAMLAGLLGAAIVFFTLARLLLPGQRALDPRDYRLPGTLARVVTSIREGGTGEVVYSKGGTRRVDGARSLDGTAIPRGTDVLILRYERGLAYVQRWDEFFQRSEAPNQQVPLIDTPS